MNFADVGVLLGLQMLAFHFELYDVLMRKTATGYFTYR